MHPAIEVEENVELHPGDARGDAEAANGLRAVGSGGEPHVGKSRDEPAKARHRRPGDRVSDEHIARARRHAHLGFGEGGGFEFGDAERELPLHERGELVRLDVGTQPLRAARHGEHPSEVALHLFVENEQGRGLDGGFVADGERRHPSTSKIASISTAMFPGSGPMPTALRAPMP